MDHPTKKQKDEKRTTKNCKEEVIFNSDTLSKIISYLPSIDILNLSLTNTKFGIQQEGEFSLIKESVRIAVQDIATEEQLAALPRYEGESSLADYHYLQLLREPLTFDQQIEVEYANNDKSCVRKKLYSNPACWSTAISNNILRTGKHYASFHIEGYGKVFVGVMRPGQATQHTSGTPDEKRFFQQFSKRLGSGGSNNENSIQCCLYYAHSGDCYSSDWGDSYTPDVDQTWDGSESMSSDGKIGMLLDLDEGSLTVYKNGRKLGVMKRGLAGQYCWVVSMQISVQVTIKRGTIPPN